MAHDFAKQRQSPKPSGQRKKNSRVVSTQTPAPSSHWSWFFTGLLCGIFSVFIAYLAVLKPGGSAPLAAASSGQENPAAQTDASSGTEFGFYQYLPKAEVQVDVVPVDIAAQEAADEAINYLLQAGSFQNRNDAEDRRAKIILLNMDAKVVPGIVSGKTWYRVQVGPFAGRHNTEDARDILSSNNIDTIPLRMNH